MDQVYKALSKLAIECGLEAMVGLVFKDPGSSSVVLRVAEPAAPALRNITDDFPALSSVLIN